MNSQAPQMTVQDLHNILMDHANDRSLKEMSLVMFESNNGYGATMFFNEAIHDRKGKKSMQKLTERINQFYINNYGGKSN